MHIISNSFLKVIFGLVLGLGLESLASTSALGSLVLVLASDLWPRPQEVWPR